MPGDVAISGALCLAGHDSSLPPRVGQPLFQADGVGLPSPLEKGLFIGLGVLGMRSRNNLPMEKLHNYPAIECPYLGLIGKPD